MQVSWDSLYADIEACEKCGLCRRIHHKVPGQGDGNAERQTCREKHHKHARSHKQ